MTTGHIMLDIAGYALTPLEKDILKHPQVGGIILFSRNYESKKQLNYLTREIHQKAPNCLIAVDQEGGRVQRFRKDFSPLPPFKTYGQHYEQDPFDAKQYAEKMGTLMAQELQAVGVDLSFTPVLDIDRGQSEVIGDRSFHSHKSVVIELALAFINGMHAAGMPATGKHFPGHGAVSADSHTTLPVDPRSYDKILAEDLPPFIALSPVLDAMMPAHIHYENVDSLPPCFSSFWLQTVLRNQLNFTGVIFSDDLSMAGAHAVGDHVQRAEKALTAGCDMVLICNQQNEAIRVLDTFEKYHNPSSLHRLLSFRKRTY